MNSVSSESDFTLGNSENVPKTVTSKSRKDRHKRSIHTCDIPECSKQFTGSYQLLRHRKLCHEELQEWLVCKFYKCGKKFPNKWSLKHHEKKHAINKSYRCSLCSASFQKKKQLHTHLHTHLGDHPFRCSSCKVNFTNEEEWHKHKLIHFPYSCICGEMFNLWSELQKHKKICEEELSCNICDQVFINKSILKLHRTTHDDPAKANYICGHDDCNKKYQYKRNLVIHVKKHKRTRGKKVCSLNKKRLNPLVKGNMKFVEDRENRCNISQPEGSQDSSQSIPNESRFPNENEVVELSTPINNNSQNSSQDESNNRSLPDENKNLSSKAVDLSTLPNTDSQNSRPEVLSDCQSSSECDTEKKFKCTIDNCKAVFSKNRKLINHIRRHMGERPFVCDVDRCTKSYTNSSHLLRHKKTFHEKKTDAFICRYQTCKQILTSKWNLTRHYKRKHNPEKSSRFNCSECFMGFSKKKRLLKHQYVHGTPTFKCDRCNIIFSCESEFSKHNRRHKTYTCSCGKVYNLWSKLLSHKRRCKLELTCETCSKTFGNRSNLRQHVITHDDARKGEYICGHENCDRKYQYKKNLGEHIKSRHLNTDDGSRIPCTYKGCTQYFKLELYLRRHLRTQHGMRGKPKKEPRTLRKDKGKPKKSMASMLSGIELTRQEDVEIINATSGTMEISDPGLVHKRSVLKRSIDLSKIQPELTVRVERMHTPNDVISLSNELQTSEVDLCSVDDNTLLECCDSTLRVLEKQVIEDSRKLISA